VEIEHHDKEWPSITLHVNTSAKPSHTVIGMARVFEQALNIAHRKDAMYGAAWAKQGWMGNLARMMSKMSRLRNMLWQSYQVEDSEETVNETAYDLIAISTFFLLNRSEQNQWGEGV
jgi:hypothetical protein